MYLHPRWAIEFEEAEMRASRPNGLKDVNVGILSGRLVATPLKAGALSFLIGGGAGVSTETNFMHSYGLDALVGAKVALGENAALRVDGVWDWLANQDWNSYRSVRVGISVYRHPSRITRLVRTSTMTTPPPTVTYRDSVSAAEIRRLRDRDAALNALRDSLRNAPRTPIAADVTTMQAQIHFAFDKSELTDAAKAILDAKVALFRAHPDMSISMVGYTDPTGTDVYNMALGTRRANAAKAYIVAQGIDANRIIIASEGEREQIPSSTGTDDKALNRRAVFRVIIHSDARTQR